MSSAPSEIELFDTPGGGTNSRRVGMAALCGLFLGTYLLLASPLHKVVPSPQSLCLFVPAVIGAGFLMAGRFLGMVLEPTFSRRRRIVRASVTMTLLLAVALCATLRLRSLRSRGGEVARTEAHRLPVAPLDAAAAAAATTAAATARGRPWLEIACMVTVEESIKLLPVFFLVRRRTIRTGAEAMWAGALAGLCFGMIEAVNHGFFLYARLASPATTYLVRALVMAPSHGIGAAIACGTAFATAQRRVAAGDEATPQRRDMLVGFLVAAMMHASHNGLQAVFGPSAQIATVFIPLVLLYGLSRGMARPAPVPVLIAASLARPARSQSSRSRPR